MDAAAHSHASSLRVYVAVYVALLVLTGVTVGVSYLGLPSTLSVVAALAIAIMKGTLVALYFMHLKDDSRFHGFIFAAAFWFMLVFFAFTALDLLTRDALLPEQGNFTAREAAAEAR